MTELREETEDILQKTLAENEYLKATVKEQREIIMNLNRKDWYYKNPRAEMYADVSNIRLRNELRKYSNIELVSHTGDYTVMVKLSFDLDPITFRIPDGYPIVAPVALNIPNYYIWSPGNTLESLALSLATDMQIHNKIYK